MRGPNGTRWLLAMGLVALVALPSGAAKPAVEILETPDVVVANPAKNMTQQNFNPDYVFSVKIRVTNDDDAREINTEAIIYPDPSVDGCPRDEQAFPVSFITKNRKLDPGETVTIGGVAHPQDGGPNEYWPMAISRTYRDGRTGENVSIESATYPFCANLRVSGNDPACDKPADRTCVLSPTPFETYVRRTNSLPQITEFSIGETEPDPGQQVLFRAEATDADTEPRPDPLSFEWDLGPTTKTGKVVRYAYTVTGDHQVTLTVSDGFDTVQRTQTLTVPGSGGDGGEPNASPSLGVGTIVALLALAVVAFRRR